MRNVVRLDTIGKTIPQTYKKENHLLMSNECTHMAYHLLGVQPGMCSADDTKYALHSHQINNSGMNKTELKKHKSA